MDRIGRYRIIRELGAGGMGHVYLAEDPNVGRDVAIKIIRLREFDDVKRKFLHDRLIREAKAAGKLTHPGIVTVYDSSEENGVHYVVMEFVDGSSLEKKMEDGSAPPASLLLTVAAQTAHALDHAHSQGVIHRDIKPANIMVSKTNQVKICDFGVAKVPQMHGIQATQTGVTLGSPQYMSPEQIRARPIDGRSDQFSLAVVCYQMLVGRRPFLSDNFFDLQTKIVTENPQPADLLNPTLSPGIRTVLETGLAKQPSHRFESCTEFAAALTAACSQTAGWRPYSRSENAQKEANLALHAPPTPRRVRLFSPDPITDQKDENRARYCPCGNVLAPGAERCDYCASFGSFAGFEPPPASPSPVPSVLSPEPLERDTPPRELIHESETILQPVEPLPEEEISTLVPAAPQPAGTGAYGGDKLWNKLLSAVDSAGDWLTERLIGGPDAVWRWLKETNTGTRITLAAVLAGILLTAGILLFTSRLSIGDELTEARANVAYIQPLRASGGVAPFHWRLLDGELPPGLNLDEDGSISGVPRRDGAYRFRVRVADADMAIADRECVLTVRPAPAVQVPRMPLVEPPPEPVKQEESTPEAPPIACSDQEVARPADSPAVRGNREPLWTPAPSKLPP
ncbi:MAG: serine/threonine-protein kinase, partial [Acidobacteria bacterium]|nr:serine/threonine-protein kinase [Acidobacteriota bacterium]